MSWVTSGLSSPATIALDATYAYVTNYTGNSISKILLSNGSVTSWVTSGLSTPATIALDATYAYVTNYSGNSISKILLSNKSVTSWVTTGLNYPHGIALDASYAYVTNYTDNYVSRYFISPPTNVTATPGINSVDLSWNSVSGGNTYNIHYGPTASYGTTITGVTTTSSNVSLTPGTLYNFAIQAVNGSTISSNSNNVTSIPTVAAPTNVVATPGINSVDLSWNSVSGATSYIISYKTDADSVWQTKTFTPN